MLDFGIFAHGEAWGALVTLTIMEIVLGIDNIVFISILTDKVVESRRAKVRTLGLGLALFSRLGLLATISYVAGLTTVMATVFGVEITGRSLILGAGGVFLIGKATLEIFDKLEGGGSGGKAREYSAVISVLIQIMLLDIVFSLDSVVTAVGMAQHLLVMVIAMVIAVIVMMIFAGVISDFINGHPSMKILALSFLILIGVMLVAESLGHHIDKGYIYFAMSFSFIVEMINLRIRRKTRKPIELRPGRRHPTAS